MTSEEQSLLLHSERPRIIRFLISLGCSFQNAEDIVQNMHVNLLESKYNINDNGYFYQMAKCRFIDLGKKIERTKKKEQNKPLVAEENVVYFDEYDGLNAAIRRLPTKAQMAIKMLYWENKSRNEIAKAIGMTENGAKNVIMRAKEKIKRYLLEKEKGK